MKQVPSRLRGGGTTRYRRDVSARLVALALILYGRGRITGDELAAKLGINTRTVYRDIERLQQLQLPIVAAPGPGGGFMFDDASGLALDAEGGGLLDLFTRTGLLATAPASGATTLEAILGQVGDELDPTDRDTVIKVRDRVLFDPEEWYARDRPPEDLHQLRHAVIHDLQLRLTYTERDGRTVEADTFDSYGLVWKGGFWYLFGLSHTSSTLRRIRVNRLTRIEPTGVTFRRPDHFDLLQSWRDDLQAFGKGTIRVVLHIGEEAISEFENFNWKRENTVTKHPDHWVVEMHVDQYGWLVPLVLSYAGAVTVLEPDGLRDQVIGAAEVVLSQHAARRSTTKPKQSTRHDDIRSRASTHRASQQI